MIWVGIIALAILLAVAISVGRALDTWTHALEKEARAHAIEESVGERVNRLGQSVEYQSERIDMLQRGLKEHRDKVIAGVDAALEHVDRETKALAAPPLPPLPSCLCGSIDLLLLNGYQRVRIVACQRCSKVFGVDAAGVRFDRHAEALPEYMTQRGMRALAREEMQAAALEDMERLKPRPSPMSRGRGRELIERPSA